MKDSRIITRRRSSFSMQISVATQKLSCNNTGKNSSVIATLTKRKSNMRRDQFKSLDEEIQVWEELCVLCEHVVDVLDWLDVPEQLKIPQVQLRGNVRGLQ